MSSEAYSTVLLWVAVGEIFFALPFILKLIPPNRTIGLLAQTAMKDSQLWYLGHLRLGISLCMAGIVTGLMSLIFNAYADLALRTMFVSFAIVAPLAISLKNSSDFMRQLIKQH